MTSDHAVARPVQTVLVIGAGVAGSAAAFWLDHHGFDVTMIEKQATTEFDAGYLTDVNALGVDTWSRGRVVLVGDAAHCLDPLSGQGTNTALLGGYTLAGELRRAAGDHEQALRAYEDRLRPYTRLSQEIVAAGVLYTAASGLREQLPVAAKGLAEVASTIAGMRPREVLGALRARPQEYSPYNLA